MSVLTLSINIDTLTDEPHIYHLIATPQERVEVAKRLNLLSLEKLEANVQLEKRGRIHLTGKINADVTQECVRTLQPLPQHLVFHADEIFTLSTPQEEGVIKLTEEGIIEPLEGPILDVGEVVIQLLSLNLDPFPVAPSSSPIVYKEDESNSSPFETLKRK